MLHEHIECNAKGKGLSICFNDLRKIVHECTEEKSGLSLLLWQLSLQLKLITITLNAKYIHLTHTQRVYFCIVCAISPILNYICFTLYSWTKLQAESVYCMPIWLLPQKAQASQ